MADARGVLGVLGYAPDDDGLAVPELGITLARDAVVVRRGVPRVHRVKSCPRRHRLPSRSRASSRSWPSPCVRPRPSRLPMLAAIWPDDAITGNRSLALAHERRGGALAIGLVRSPKGTEVQKLSIAAAR